VPVVPDNKPLRPDPETLTLRLTVICGHMEAAGSVPAQVRSVKIPRAKNQIDNQSMDTKRVSRLVRCMELEDNPGCGWFKDGIMRERDL